MKKQHKRVLIFIGLKLVELIGFVVFIAVWAGLMYLIEEHQVALYIFFGVFSVLLVFVIICVVRENWAWAGRIARRKK